jgi:orotidine-5'-phosphate decarboxylase
MEDDIKKLALALDVPNIEEAKQILDQIEYKIIIKVGYSLFIKYGKDLIDLIKKRDFEIFLDLKLHDIPNTVFNGVKSASELGVDYLTIHTLGGEDMLKKAVEAKGNSNLKLLGVTILTSHTEDYLTYLGTKYNLEQLVLKLAETAINNNVDGIVCSSLEVEMLKNKIKKNFIAVVPGIRPEEDEKDDQRRIATPKEAVKKGADILVIGRPILKAKDKNEKIYKILKEIEELNRLCFQNYL